MYRTGQTLFVVTLLLLLAGCSALEFVQKAPEREDETAPPPTEKPADCDWQEVRGVAELIAINNGDGTFMFYPGEHEVSAQVEEGWEEGQEFTGILQQPEPEDCANPKLRIVEPLAP